MQVYHHYTPVEQTKQLKQDTLSNLSCTKTHVFMRSINISCYVILRNVISLLSPHWLQSLLYIGCRSQDPCKLTTCSPSFSSPPNLSPPISSPPFCSPINSTPASSSVIFCQASSTPATLWPWTALNVIMTSFCIFLTEWRNVWSSLRPTGYG